MFKALKKDLSRLLHRSVVRSAADANHRNKRLSLKSDMQLRPNKLSTRPGITIENYNPTNLARNINDEISIIFRSKRIHIDHGHCVTNRSKMQRKFKLSAILFNMLY
jgi:hypothetical protein